MRALNRWRTGLTALATAGALIACGGSNNSAPGAAPPPTDNVAQEAGAPSLSNNVAVDGLNWINYRRGQIGMPALARNSVIDRVAQAHADYQKLNNTVTHNESAGLPGYTGADLLDRFNAAGYTFANNAYAYGEVISATTNHSGFYMAEELITAIYHRFVIFEPTFKEAGAGAATTSAGYTYFTCDFAANQGYGPGLGSAMVVPWPASGQSGVTPNFFSDNETPDPVDGANEVGYPVSVHADITTVLNVVSFTMHPHGGADLAVKQLTSSNDVHTPRSAAAIVPLAVLKSATTYDVSFAGTADGIAVGKNWSFTTK